MNRQALIELREKVEAGALVIDDVHESAEVEFAYERRFMQAYLGSLDAALALHNAVLPGWTCGLQQLLAEDEDDVSDDWRCILHKAIDCRDSVERECNNPARAWLLSILDALIAEGGEG